jgi:hypothetical protein
MAKIVWSSEKELEDFIYSKLEDLYNPIDESRVDWFGRQIDLGQYGIIDLMTINFDAEGEICIDVFELKKELITIKTLGQVARYVRGLRQYFDESAKHLNVTVRGNVVAPEIDHSDDTVFLINMLEDIHVYTVDFDLDNGVSFDWRSCRSWSRTSPDFSKFHTIHGLSIIADSEKRKADYDAHMGNFSAQEEQEAAE